MIKAAQQEKTNYMQQHGLELSIFSINILFGFIPNIEINYVSAILSLLFLVAYKLPKFIYYISKSNTLVKKWRKGDTIHKKDIEDIYEDEN